MFDDTTEAAWLCTCCHPALTHMHETAGDEACSVPGCGCVEFIRHPNLTNFTGETLAGTYHGTEDPLPAVPDVESICVMDKSKGPLICERVPKEAASVRLCLMNELDQVVYRTFYLTGERDAAGRPIYRERLA